MIATLIAWSKSLVSRPAVERPLTNRGELLIWIRTHMPDLHHELRPLRIDQVRIRLNEITGCTVKGGDTISSGSVIFLEALKRMKEAA